jgi:hypothetical protein
VVVGEVDDVEAAAPCRGAQRRRAAAEGELLGHRRAPAADRALEVGEGEVGRAQRPADAGPRVARAVRGDLGARAVPQVDVADRGEPQPAHP